MHVKDKKPLNEQGEKHGMREGYHENGQLWFKGQFINGKAFGKHESYWSNGELRYIMNYINNELHGYTLLQSHKIYYAK